MCRGDARRQHETIVVRMRHDERADHPRGHAPARRPRVLELARRAIETESRMPSRSFAPENARSLPGWLFDPGPSPRCKASGPRRESARFRSSRRQSPELPDSRARRSRRRASIFIVSSRASASVSCAVWPSCQRNSAVRRNKRGRKLPANDIRPLIKENGQVTPGLDPARVRCTDDRLRGRPNDERLAQLARRQRACRPYSPDDDA